MEHNMPILLLDQEFEVPAVQRRNDGLLAHLRRECVQRIPEGLIPVRFVVTSTTPSVYQCELGALSGLAAFPAEQATAMSLDGKWNGKEPGLDVAELWQRKRRMIGDTPLADENPESRDKERSLAETIRLIAEATDEKAGD